ncbi:MAG: hypothetical protein AAFN92_13120, partial [Bacteroidota bacterium]
LSDKIWREADAAVDKGKELKDQASEAINRKLEDLKPKEEAPHPFDTDLDLSDLTPDGPERSPKAGAIDFEDELVEDPTAPKVPGKLKSALGAAAATAGEAAKTAGAVADSALNTAAKAGAAAADKLGKFSETVGKEVMEKGDDVLNRAAEVGADLKGKFDDFVDHANVEAEKMRLEDSIEEAKAAAAQAEARAKAFDGEEAARDTSESILDGTDSFFDRAARYADGNYHDKDVTIGKSDAPEQPKEDGGLISGFLDSDGDGDSLIDDAVIEEE